MVMQFRGVERVLPVTKVNNSNVLLKASGNGNFRTG